MNLFFVLKQRACSQLLWVSEHSLKRKDKTINDQGGITKRQECGIHDK
jgi:hypothetical protein